MTVRSVSQMQADAARAAHARWRDGERTDVVEVAPCMPADGSRLDVANCPTIADLYERSVRASRNRWREAKGDGPVGAPAYQGGRP